MLPLGSEPSIWADVLATSADEAAPRLLGALLQARNGLVIRLTEVEAYTGPGTDEASHAHRGLTARNAAMFSEPGVVYVYLSYGIHRCVNIVAHPPGSAGGVLLRSATIENTDVATDERSRNRLASGPGRLGRSVGATLEDSGSSLFGGGLLRFLSGPDALPAAMIADGPRIGISRATDRRWRFWIRDDPSVSR